jgi:hypothetical protein
MGGMFSPYEPARFPEILFNFRSLTDLSIHCCPPVTDKLVWSILARNEQLQRLSIDQSKHLTGEFLTYSPQLELSKLTHVHLSDCKGFGEPSVELLLKRTSGRLVHFAFEYVLNLY